MKTSQTRINEIRSEVFYLQQGVNIFLKKYAWKKTPAEVKENSYYITQCILICSVCWECDWLQMEM